MSLKHKVYDASIWHNIFDSAVDPKWIEDYADEYRRTWPNYRPEITPVALPEESISTFTLRSLTREQLAHVDRMEGQNKIREIVAYGCVGWSGVLDSENKEFKPEFTKDDLGKRLTVGAVEYLNFFGFSAMMSMTLAGMLSTLIMSITRSLPR